MTVAEFIKKWHISEKGFSIYDKSLDREIYDYYETRNYMNSIVVDTSVHTGEPVLWVEKK